MKISCQSCGAKYTIADEKVVGKIVKIRCKKCSSTIVINGNDSAALAAGGADSAALPEFAPTAALSGEPWTVNVGDGDQRTLSLSEIVQLYKSGEVTEETYCWKDGMADWLPIREIDQVFNACTVCSTLEPDGELQSSGLGGMGSNGFGLGGGGAGGGGGGGGMAGLGSNGNGAHEEGPTMVGDSLAASSGPSAAARRAGGRGAGGADLFGAAARAGAEEDVMTSAPMGGGGGGAGLDDAKLTGQRNENSVLFSLSALTQSAPEPSSSKVTEGSGLIDIRALASAPKADDSSRKAKVDDIMNLGGGGAFSAALAAPVLAAPPLEMMGSSADAQPNGGGNNKMVFAILGGFALLAVAIVAVMLMKSPDKTVTQQTLPMPSGSALAAPGDTTSPGIATATPSATVAAAPTDTTSPTPAAPGTGGAVALNNKPTAGHGGGNGGHSPIPDPTPDSTPAPTPSKPPPSLAQQIAAAGGDPGGGVAPASAPSGGSAPFDRGAAAAALGAVNVGACKKADGPTGSGHVSVTFSPSGSVTTAVVDAPPFDGTSVGGCVAGKFRGAHIPAFAGSAVKVGKSFTIN